MWGVMPTLETHLNSPKIPLESVAHPLFKSILLVSVTLLFATFNIPDHPPGSNSSKKHNLKIPKPFGWLTGEEPQLTIKLKKSTNMLSSWNWLSPASLKSIKMQLVLVSRCELPLQLKSQPFSNAKKSKPLARSLRSYHEIGMAMVEALQMQVCEMGKAGEHQRSSTKSKESKQYNMIITTIQSPSLLLELSFFPIQTITNIQLLLKEKEAEMEENMRSGERCRGGKERSKKVR